jgi:hypothetical protein
MSDNYNLESIDNIIHKEKEPKRKLKTKGLLSIGQLDYRTVGKNSTSENKTQQAKVTEVTTLQDNRNINIATTRNQMLNYQIDEFLEELLMDKMISEQFLPFYAKACHKLGITTVNRLRVNALNGNDKQKLFAYKVKGALQIYYKREFEALQ